MYGIKIGTVRTPDPTNNRQKYQLLEAMMEWSQYNNILDDGDRYIIRLIRMQEEPFFREKLKRTFHYDDEFLNKYIRIQGASYSNLYDACTTIYMYSLTAVSILTMDRLKDSRADLHFPSILDRSALRWIMDDIISRYMKYGKSWASDHPADTGYAAILRDMNWATRGHTLFNGVTAEILSNLIDSPDYGTRFLSSYLIDLVYDTFAIVRQIVSWWDQIPRPQRDDMVFYWYRNTFLSYQNDIKYISENESERSFLKIFYKHMRLDRIHEHFDDPEDDRNLGELLDELELVDATM